MARAAIKLSRDISPYLAFLSRQIEGCAYNANAGQLGFRRDNMVVVIYPREINIYKIENEVAAKNVIDWLIQILDHANITL